MDTPIDYPKRRVMFKGPVAEVSLTGPVTHIRYGRHKDGDILWVHSLDAQAWPESFVAPPEEQAEEPLPINPEDIRRVLVPPMTDIFVTENADEGPIEVEGRPKKRVATRKVKASDAED